MIQEYTPAKVGLLEPLLTLSGVRSVIPAYQRYTWTANKELKQQLYDEVEY